MKNARRWFVPEVVQSSAMDCGPASLKSLLEGFGIAVSYGRLREACQTEIDGTSIDAMETVAQQAGLAAEQIMVPPDFILLKKADLLPALVVVQLPSGATHFVIAWNCVGPWVQIMDPATGRRWQHKKKFLRDIYMHSQVVSAEDWTEWSLSEESLGPLAARMKELRIATSVGQQLVAQVVGDGGWRPVAALDAAIRLVESLVGAGGVRRGAEADRVLLQSFNEARRPEIGETDAIPSVFWSVAPEGNIEDGGEMLRLRGAVLVRVRGKEAPTHEIDGGQAEHTETFEIPPELHAAFSEKPTSPPRELFRLLLRDGLKAPILVMSGIVVSSATVMIEALLFRGLLDFGMFLGLPEQRFAAVAAVVLLLLGLLLLALPTMSASLREGRHLETRLRMAFMGKLPRLADRYFSSRLSSDMAERAHVLHKLRSLPSLVVYLWRSMTLLVATTIGIIWLDPKTAPIATTAAIIAVALPLISQRLMVERDLRVRTHTGALTRFFLDSLLGLTALRCHAAERTVRREHEMLLVEWARASIDLLRIAITVEGLTAFAGYTFAVWILFDHFARAGGSGMVLLLVYWVLGIPALGQDIAVAARQIPTMRNVALRVFEPLAAPDENAQNEFRKETRHTDLSAMSLKLDGVSVVAGGNTILDRIDLRIEAGSHVAIVGPSGAGKSSLVRLFLGLHRPVKGSVFVDGKRIDGREVLAPRHEIAWVDPAVHLWNKSFVDNIFYGATSGTSQTIADILQQASLFGVLEGLPDGLQTILGEGGGLVSGGEGQRLRFARALNRDGVRLAILDEPFRGLAREQRRDLLRRARQRWRDNTLLWVTHDLRETLAFDRVIVIEGGRVVEDGSPSVLRADPNSRFGALLTADEEMNSSLWFDPTWRRLELRDGELREERPGER